MKQYEIHDNGGRPFLVDVSHDHVIISKQEQDFDIGNYRPPKKILETPFRRIFLGDKPQWQNPNLWREDFVGNTILLELHGGKFLSIGPSIREFKPVKGDTIVEYFSEVGNNDVPQAHAVGKKYMYFFSQNMKDIFTLPVRFFHPGTSVQDQFWLDFQIKDCKSQPSLQGTPLCQLWKHKDPELEERLEFLQKYKSKIRSKIIQKRL